ncbi:hypothetical protein FISHEDRAFT_59199 [Fistulina hepatica ATCC 64428]|uniref:DUF6533 domain-containing protein n=1 Tax=Fistulina hepatica ATCC 64428 TaxID=1128425 RepID=A0A0D7ADX4_9AGAR|nr:hypothetical protein FISHEDRAFT_59199 [Fistulina hepatica ATCC 64428]
MTVLFKYMHIVACSFWTYDWMVTLPAEACLVKSQVSERHTSPSWLLFTLARYLGIIALIVSCVGIYPKFWTETACARYYRVVPIIQCIALWASHAVLVYVTGLDDIPCKAVLSILALIVSGVEIFGQLYSFGFDVSKGGCFLNPSDTNVAAITYLSSALFVVVTAMFTVRALHKARRTTLEDIWNTSTLPLLVIMLLSDAANIACYAAFALSTSRVLVPIGIATTSIMSARAVLRFQDELSRRRKSAPPWRTFHSLGLAATLAPDRRNSSISYLSRPPTDVSAGVIPCQSFSTISTMGPPRTAYEKILAVLDAAENDV